MCVYNIYKSALARPADQHLLALALSHALALSLLTPLKIGTVFFTVSWMTVSYLNNKLKLAITFEIARPFWQVISVKLVSAHTVFYNRSIVTLSPFALSLVSLRVCMHIFICIYTHTYIFQTHIIRFPLFDFSRVHDSWAVMARLLYHTSVWSKFDNIEHTRSTNVFLGTNI